ncbi:MAG: Gfo/Idh/MocA family oxidoreductase [Burkholderiales bacterium]
MKKLRVGIVGADPKGAGWGPLAHIPALRALPDFEIVALCGSREETARAAAERYGVPRAYAHVDAMVADPDVDIVTCAVRAPNHHAVVMAALHAGKPVYCEWPLGANTAQAEEMAALARTKGVPAAIGLQARCDPTLRYVRDLVAQGYVGDVLAVNMAMISPGVPERAKSRSWEATLAGGVSALTIRGMHSLDPLCMCVGEFEGIASRVTTQVKRWKITDTGEAIGVEVPDNVMLHGVVQGGAVVSAHIATLPTAAPGFRMEIYGSDGVLSVATPGAPQRDANKLSGAKGRAAPAPMEVPASYVDVPAGTPAGPPHNVAALYRRLGNALRSGAPVDPGFDHAVERHRLIDRIARGG